MQYLEGMKTITSQLQETLLRPWKVIHISYHLNPRQQITEYFNMANVIYIIQELFPKGRLH